MMELTTVRLAGWMTTNAIRTTVYDRFGPLRYLAMFLFASSFCDEIESQRHKESECGRFY